MDNNSIKNDQDDLPLDKCEICLKNKYDKICECYKRICSKCIYCCGICESCSLKKKKIPQNTLIKSFDKCDECGDDYQVFCAADNCGKRLCYDCIHCCGACQTCSMRSGMC